MPAKRWRFILDYIGLIVGVGITAAALAWFLIPNKIAAGGVSGLATVLFHLFGLPVGAVMLALNVPLFLASWRIIGAIFGAKTLIGAVAVSLLVDFFGQFAVPITTDPLLATIYGGVGAGIGLGLAFRFGGSTGGTDMAAQLAARYLPLSVGQALLMVDGLVILFAGLVFGAELALYALLAVFVTTKVIDLIQEGQVDAKAAYIISEHSEQIGRNILYEMERGATAFRGQGLYSGTDRQVLFVVVSRSELSRLKQLVYQADPQAFMVITDAHEVLGEGFYRLS